MIKIGTSQTWAYINAQLDYPVSKQRRVHIVIGKRTICGLSVSSAWETAEIEPEIFLAGWSCVNCRRGAGVVPFVLGTLYTIDQIGKLSGDYPIIRRGMISVIDLKFDHSQYDFVSAGELWRLWAIDGKPVESQQIGGRAVTTNQLTTLRKLASNGHSAIVPTRTPNSLIRCGLIARVDRYYHRVTDTGVDALYEAGLL